MPELTGSEQHTFVHQLRKIARRRCRGCARDGDVISGAQTSSKPVRTFTQHAQQRLLLPRIQLPAQPIQHSGFLNQKLDVRRCASLRFDSDAREPGKPCGHFVLLVRSL